jgi:selenocysteine lyase/cysteine desulfurase
VSEEAALKVAQSGEKTGCNDALSWIEQPAGPSNSESNSESSSGSRSEGGASAAPPPLQRRETRPLGSLRASLGYLSTKADVLALAAFVGGYADRTPPEVDRDDVAGGAE